MFLRAIISEQGQQHGIPMSAKLQIRAEHVTKQNTPATCAAILRTCRVYDECTTITKVYITFERSGNCGRRPRIYSSDTFMMFLTRRLVSVQEHEANSAVVGLFFQVVYSTL